MQEWKGKGGSSGINRGKKGGRRKSKDKKRRAEGNRRIRR